MWIDRYLEWGFSLVPLKRDDKAPAVEWKKLMTQRMSKAEIEDWKRKTANFGAICGAISGDLLVVDIDREELFSELNIGEVASETFTVRTKKGYHIYLRIAGVESKSLVWNGEEEIRFQGEGMYVVIAGSKHPSGGTYEHFLTSPVAIKRADAGILEEIERRWKKHHGLDRVEEKREIMSWKSKRGRELEEFKKHVDITAVITKWVRPTSDYGEYWQGHCPFHADANPSFTVYKSGAWYCFGCEKGGDVITFVEEAEKLRFGEAIKKISDITGVLCVDENKRLAPTVIKEMICETERFITLRDTEEILNYRDGCWHFDGETVVKERVNQIMDNLGRKHEATNHLVAEVLGHVTRDTYCERGRLNQERGKINMLNGVYDVEKAELLPHSSDYCFTYRMPVEYVRAADTDDDAVSDFLFEVLPEEDVKVAVEFIAYCLVPAMPYHRALMLLGDGANGKSTFIELVRSFLGRENTVSVSLQTLLENRFASSELYGKLANLYADLPDTALKQTGMFKLLTGGDVISAEKKFCPMFQFQNVAKLLFSANKLPYALDDTAAFFRRWIILNFPNKFEGERMNPKKLEEITTPAALSSFFNFVVLALHSLNRRGFSYSRTTEEIREDYVLKSNPTKAFVERMLVADPEGFETKEDVYGAYVAFCQRMRLPAAEKSVFGRLISRYILTKSSRRMIRGERVYCWEGLQLKEACGEE